MGKKKGNHSRQPQHGRKQIRKDNGVSYINQRRRYPVHSPPEPQRRLVTVLNDDAIESAFVAIFAAVIGGFLLFLGLAHKETLTSVEQGPSTSAEHAEHAEHSDAEREEDADSDQPGPSS